jgi:hypothetical protein
VGKHRVPIQRLMREFDADAAGAVTTPQTRIVDEEGNPLDIGAADMVFSPAGAGAVTTTVQAKLREISFSVVDKGADPTGIASSAAAFSLVWQQVLSTRTAPSANNSYVTLVVDIPPGVYLIDESVNWTGLLTWNVHVRAHGAVVIGKVAGGNVIDMTNTRGLHIHGLEVYGDATDKPACGILLGPKNTDACGNNAFHDVKVQGYFSVAAVWNIGSETTPAYNSYFANSDAGAAAVGYLADGRNAFGAASAYTTIRGANTAVSFTVSKFNDCHIRNYGGGRAAYLDAVKVWHADSCYFLSFGAACVAIYNDATFRNADIRISGSFETTQAPGMTHLIEFLTPAATASAINGFELKTSTINSKTAAIKHSDPAAGTPGTLNIRGADIALLGDVAAGTYIDGTNLNISGRLTAVQSASMDFTKLNRLHGEFFTTAFASVVMPAGASNHAFTAYDDTTQFVVFPGAQNYVGIQSSSTNPLIRAEGASADIDLRLQGKGAGYVRFGTRTANADAAVTGYIEIKDAAGTVRKLALIA